MRVPITFLLLSIVLVLFMSPVLAHLPDQPSAHTTRSKPIEDSASISQLSQQLGVGKVAKPAQMTFLTENTGLSKNSALILTPDQTFPDAIDSSQSFRYYRYFTQLPYQFVRLQLVSETGTSVAIVLEDMYGQLVAESSTSSTFQEITVGKTDAHSGVRFVGWYYVTVELLSGQEASYNLTLSFLESSGSSMLQATELTDGVPWVGTFGAAESSGARSSSFYKLYVPQDGLVLSYIVVHSRSSVVRLYDPSYHFLNYDDTKEGEWLATQVGYYYFEVSGSPGIYLSFEVSLGSDTTALGDTFTQPRPVSREGTSDVFRSEPTFLSLYLFRGENLTLSLQNYATSDSFQIALYYPWGNFWQSAVFPSKSGLLDLCDIPTSGRYVLYVGGAISLTPHFHEEAPSSITWRSATQLHFTDRHNLSGTFQQHNTHYYTTLLTMGEGIEVLHSSSGSTVAVLGPLREILALGQNSGSGPVVLPPVETETRVYIRVTTESLPNSYTLNLTKITTYSSGFSLEGCLSYLDQTTGVLVPVPLLTMEVLDSDTSTDDLIHRSTTNRYGCFSTFVTTVTDEDEGNFDPYLRFSFAGPSARVVDKNDESSTFGFDVMLNYTGHDKSYQLGNLVVPSSEAVIANIFTEVTTAWLWVEDIGPNYNGPEIVTIRYATGSTVGTWYSPAEEVAGKLRNYVLTLLGSSSDDDGWDKAVIRHEYGHHVQHVFDIANNPTGYHQFSTVVSPEFAHAEGWPTFFSSLISGDVEYKDTYGNEGSSFFGLNVETGKGLTNGRSYASMGEWSEASMLALYWDLYDDVVDDHNGNGIGEDVSLSEDVLWEVFVSYRTMDLSGPLTLSDVYSGLVKMLGMNANELPRLFFEHGAGSVTPPFADKTENITTYEDDLEHPIVWTLIDQDPRSYRFFVDGVLLDEGQWTYPGENLTVWLNDLSLSLGERHALTVELTDSRSHMVNESVYVVVLPQNSKLGDSFTTAQALDHGEVILDVSDTFYYLYYDLPHHTTVNICIDGLQVSDLTFTVYDSSQLLLESMTTPQTSHFYSILKNQSTRLYFKVGSVTGGEVKVTVSLGPLGSSFTNAVPLTTPSTLLTLPGPTPNGSLYCSLVVGPGSYYWEVLGEEGLAVQMDLLSHSGGYLTGKTFSTGVGGLLLTLSHEQTIIARLSSEANVKLVITPVHPLEVRYDGEVLFKEGDKNRLSWFVESGDPNLARVELNGSFVGFGILANTTLYFDLSGQQAGTYNVRLVVGDRYGQSVEYGNLTVTIVAAERSTTNSSSNSGSSEELSPTLLVFLLVFFLAGVVGLNRRKGKR